tara:strand:- start:3341 stop:4843 length:1503 start_codon:yes stop_codon:yes gene_type:complete
MSKYIEYFNETKKDVQTDFIIKNIPVALANSIRRILLSNIPVVAFDDIWDDNEHFRSINIKKNTSGIHNEFLSHRISLIPLSMDNPYLKLNSKFNYKNCTREIDFNSNIVPKFYLIIKNNKETRDLKKTVGSLQISSNDFKIDNRNGNIDEIEKLVNEGKLQFFKPDPYTNDYSILDILKPNILVDDNGEELEIYVKPGKGIGLQSARYCPVGTVSYSFITNDEYANEIFRLKIDYKNKERESKGLPVYTQKEIIDLKKSFDMLDKQRVFYKNDNGDANKFQFTIESIGFLTSNQLMLDSVILLELMLRDILNSISLNKDSLYFDIVFNELKLEINESRDELMGYYINIKNENHTIGNLISEYFKEFYCKNDNPIDCNIITFSSYKMPHPLTEEIQLKIKLNPTISDENYRILHQNLLKKIFPTNKYDSKDSTISNIKTDIVKMIFIKTIINILNQISDITSEVFQLTKLDKSSFIINDNDNYYNHLNFDNFLIKDIYTI